MYREGLLILPDTADAKMILKVLPHTRKMLHHRYSQAFQLNLVANPRQHQHFRRVHRAQRQHNFQASSNELYLSVIKNLYSSRSIALQGEPSDQGVREHREILSIHVGKGIRAKYGQAFSIADSQIEDR